MKHRPANRTNRRSMTASLPKPTTLQTAASMKDLLQNLNRHSELRWFGESAFYFARIRTREIGGAFPEDCQRPLLRCSA